MFLCPLGDGHEWSLLHLKVSFVWPQQWGLGLGVVIMGNVMAAQRDVCVALPVGLGTHGRVGTAFCTSESQNEGGGRGRWLSLWGDSNLCLWCVSLNAWKRFGEKDVKYRNNVITFLWLFSIFVFCTHWCNHVKKFYLKNLICSVK